MRTLVAILLVVSMSAHAAVFAEREKAGLSAMATPEGKKYEASWGKVVGPAFKACVPSGPAASSANLGKFVLIANVARSGVVSDVDVSPSNPVSRCFAKHFAGSTLPPPPMADSAATLFPIADTFEVVQ